MVDMSISIAKLAWDLFNELNRSQNDKNIVFSPASLTASLSLLYLGSSGDTATQIAKVLHFSDQGDITTSSGDDCGDIQGIESNKITGVPEVHKALKELFNKLKSAGDAELKIANGLFTQIKFPLLSDYLKSAQEFYQAKLMSVDFVNDKTRDDINTWVASETNGKIKNLFGSNSLGRNTSLVLVNAIHFKGNWKKMFKKENTKNSPFHVKEGVEVTVQMMTQTETFKHGFSEEMDAQVLDLPYENGDFSMLVVLPNEMFGLEKVMKKIHLDSLVKLTDSKNLKETKLEIHLPRCKIEESYDLDSHLKNMGMQDAFSQKKANFSDLSAAGLYVTNMVHKVVIEINEEGTEAAAASGAVLAPKMLKLFKVNHPFLFFIKHNPTNAILFCSKVLLPSV